MNCRNYLKGFVFLLITPLFALTSCDNDKRDDDKIDNMFGEWVYSHYLMDDNDEIISIDEFKKRYGGVYESFDDMLYEFEDSHKDLKMVINEDGSAKYNNKSTDWVVGEMNDGFKLDLGEKSFHFYYDNNSIWFRDGAILGKLNNSGETKYFWSIIYLKKKSGGNI